MEDLLFNSQGNLPLERDPKLEYEIANLTETPVELNHADREVLLRVPGIGPKGAEAIIRSRSVKGINDLGQIRKLGIIAERAAPYILLNGTKADAQLPLL